MTAKRHQTKLNDDTSGAWETYAAHRAKVTATLLVAANEFNNSEHLPSCCVLGAGNGNDLDFAAAANRFSSIHLFDIDEAALSRIKTRYQDQPHVLSRLVFEEPVDVSGVFKDLDESHKPKSRSEKLQEEAELASSAGSPHVGGSTQPAGMIDFKIPAEKAPLINSAREVSLGGTSLANRKFDVVISVCLMSQLINAVVNSFPADQSPPFMIAIRDGHLNLLVRLTNQPGRCILINDFVSSDTLPQLLDADDDEKILASARKAIDERNFFTGTNPWAITDKIRPQLNPSEKDSLKVSPPWRWEIGKRCYAVTAITFARQGT